MTSVPPEHGFVGRINPCQVFVRNLPTEFLEKDLESLAEEYGPIKRVDLVKSSETKESKGFGFIKFALEDHARMAVDGLEGKMVLGKRVRAQIARRKGAKHAAKEGKSRERGGNVMDDGRGIKNATLHQNVTNATTPSKKEGTTKTVNGGCEDTTSTITSVPERVRTAVLFGLPSNISKKQLFKRVRKFGTVLDLELQPPGRMRSPLLPDSGIATVVCETKKGAKELVCKADGRIIKGSKLCARFLPGLSIGEGNNPKKRLIVRNLPWDTTEAELGDIFVTWGPLTEVKIPKVEVPALDRMGKTVSRQKSRGFGFVQYLCVEDACRVVKDHGIVNIKGRPTAVDFVTSSRSTNGSDERQQMGKEEAVAATVATADIEGGEDMAAARILEESGENYNVQSEEQLEERHASSSSSDTDDDEEDKEYNEEEQDTTSQPSTTQQLQLKSKRTSDVSHGLTVFVRNLPFDSDASDIRDRFSQFGAVAYSLPTLDKQTGLPKGTAFVKYRLKEGIDACIAAANSSEGIQLEGRELMVSKAVDRDQAVRINEQSSKPTQVDRRLLYLANEGLLIPDSQAAKETPPQDMEKRARARAEKKKKLKNPLFFINPKRLSIRNLSPKVSDDDLRKVCLDSAEKGVAVKLVSPEDEKRHLKAIATPATELTPDRLKIPPVTLASTTRCQIMRDMERKAEKDSGVHPSRGYGFVTFKYHVHALAALRYLNNNPMLSYLAKGGRGNKGKRRERDSTTDKSRLIVEFTVEDHSKIKLQESRREKQKERSKELSRVGLQPTGTPIAAKKGRGQRQREKKRNLSNIIKDQEDFSEEVLLSSKKNKKKKLLDSGSSRGTSSQHTSSTTQLQKRQRAIKGNVHPQ